MKLYWRFKDASGKWNWKAAHYRKLQNFYYVEILPEAEESCIHEKQVRT
jgi:hypothetical protein